MTSGFRPSKRRPLPGDAVLEDAQDAAGTTLVRTAAAILPTWPATPVLSQIRLGQVQLAAERMSQLRSSARAKCQYGARGLYNQIVRCRGSHIETTLRIRPRRYQRSVILGIGPLRRNRPSVIQSSLLSGPKTGSLIGQGRKSRMTDA